MALKQKVTITIYDDPDSGSVVYETSNLRVDFDVRQIPEFNRAKFTIYNLNDATINSLVSGDRYVTLKTKLRDGKEYTLADRYFVNNATDELKLPERVLTLFCMDKLRKEVLEKPIDINITNPSLRNMVMGMLGDVDHNGDVHWVSFPEGLLDEVGKRNTRPMMGSVQQCLRRLEQEYGFNTYTYNNEMRFMYKPDQEGLGKTDLNSREPDIILTTNSMRSNPKIGIASASIVSNLDPRIKPTSLLDLSQLLTVAADADQDTLELAENYLKNFSDYSKYQAFAVQHKGSNYTAEWSTIINALSPTKGKLMPTVAWADATY